jgi:hypothetical protein
MVHKLHVRRPVVGPAKAKAVLVIDPNTKLSFSFTFQRFRLVARWRAQEFNGLRRIELRQFPSYHFNNRRKSLALAYAVRKRIVIYVTVRYRKLDRGSQLKQ